MPQGLTDSHRPDSRGLTVVLPTYNEAENLEEVVSRIHAAAPDCHVLVVDDASPDGTTEIARRIATSNPWLSVLEREQKLGLGSAYLAGFAVAMQSDGGDAAVDRVGARWIAEMDADGSHRAEDLPRLLEAVHAGAGLAIGARWVPGGRIVGWPRRRQWISRLGTQVARISLRSRLHDLTSGFRVYDADWLATLDLQEIDAQGYAFQVELAWRLERLGCPISEVPITFIERARGRSKMSLRIVIEALGLTLKWGWQLRRGRV